VPTTLKKFGAYAPIFKMCPKIVSIAFKNLGLMPILKMCPKILKKFRKFWADAPIFKICP
jgi:hypothetical protein